MAYWYFTKPGESGKLVPADNIPPPIEGDNRTDLMRAQDWADDNLGEGWTAVSYLTREPEPWEMIDPGTGEIVALPGAVEAFVIDKIEREREAVSTSALRRIGKYTAILFTWLELQDYRRNTLAIEALAPLVKAKRLPFMSAHAQENGISLAAGTVWTNLANAIDNRLWADVQKATKWDARMAKRIQDAKDATTVPAKLAAAENINWDA